MLIYGLFSHARRPPSDVGGDDQDQCREQHPREVGVGGDRVWLGLGSWLFASDPMRARVQRELALAAHPAGVALFSYDAIAEAPALRAALLQSSPAP